MVDTNPYRAPNADDGAQEARRSAARSSARGLLLVALGAAAGTLLALPFFWPPWIFAGPFVGAALGGIVARMGPSKADTDERSRFPRFALCGAFLILGAPLGLLFGTAVFLLVGEPLVVSQFLPFMAIGITAGVAGAIGALFIR